MGKEKAKTVQLTLLEVLTKEEPRESLQVFSTEFFEIKTTASAIDAFKDKLEAEDANGNAKYDDDEQLDHKVAWVQSRMKPIKPQLKGAAAKNMTGEQYYLSKRSLLKQIFDEDLE